VTKSVDQKDYRELTFKKILIHFEIFPENFLAILIAHEVVPGCRKGCFRERILSIVSFICFQEKKKRHKKKKKKIQEPFPAPLTVPRKELLFLDCLETERTIGRVK